jgi:hypothetical protein
MPKFSVWENISARHGMLVKHSKYS